MNKKKLAEMLKNIKAEKMAEQVAMSREKTTTEVGSLPGAGHRHHPKSSTFNHTTGALDKRHWQKQGNQSRTPDSYVSEEDEKELGDTDTGEKKKKNTEVVNINPTMKDIAGGGLTTTKGLESK